MEERIRAGVELGWLIYPDKRTVFIYRAGQKCTVNDNIAVVKP